MGAAEVGTAAWKSRSRLPGARDAETGPVPTTLAPSMAVCRADKVAACVLGLTALGLPTGAHFGLPWGLIMGLRGEPFGDRDGELHGTRPGAGTGAGFAASAATDIAVGACGVAAGACALAAAAFAADAPADAPVYGAVNIGVRRLGEETAPDAVDGGRSVPIACDAV